MTYLKRSICHSLTVFSLYVHDAQLQIICIEAHFRGLNAIAQSFFLPGCGSAVYPKREKMEIFIKSP